MLFEEFVEQHRVDLVVADGVGFSVFVHPYQGGISPLLLLRFNTGVGAGALALTSGAGSDSNTAVGAAAMLLNTTGDRNSVGPVSVLEPSALVLNFSF